MKFQFKFTYLHKKTQVENKRKTRFRGTADGLPCCRVDRVLLVVFAHVVVSGLRQELVNALTFTNELEWTLAIGEAFYLPSRVECGKETAGYTGTKWPEGLEKTVTDKRHE